MQHFKLENWRLENWRNGEFDFWCHEKVTNDFCWKSFESFSSTQGSIEIKSFNGIPNSKVAKTTPENQKKAPELHKPWVKVTKPFSNGVPITYVVFMYSFYNQKNP